MDLLLRRFLRAGVRRGVAGNWYWFLLAGATFFLRRVLNDRTSPVSTVTVSPGRAGAHHGARPQDPPAPLPLPLPPPKPDARGGPPRGGGAGAPHRPQGPPLPADARGGRDLPHPCGRPGPRRHHRLGRGLHRGRVDRAQLPGAAPHPQRRRAQDAPGGPGHLPQGPRRHPDRRGHRPRAARPRGRRGLGRPLHDRAARRGVHRRATSCGRTSPSGRRPTWRPPSVPTRPIASRSGT